MDQPSTKQEMLFTFLVDNMKEMEKELRAHSIVMEALAKKVVRTEDLEQAMQWARGSAAMLQFVDAKYASLDAMTGGSRGLNDTTEVVCWPEGYAPGKLPN